MNGPDSFGLSYINCRTHSYLEAPPLAAKKFKAFLVREYHFPPENCNVTIDDEGETPSAAEICNAIIDMIKRSNPKDHGRVFLWPWRSRGNK